MTDRALAETRDVLARAGITLSEEASSSEVVAGLAQALTLCTDRTMHKALRREAHRLRQRGVTVPDLPPGPPTSRPILGPPIESWVSAVDGNGDRVVWLIRERGDGSLLLIAAEINEPDGLQGLHRFELTRKRLRAMRERLEHEGGIRLVAADWRHVDALVVEGADRRPAPIERRIDYRRVRSELTTTAPDAPHELESPRVTARPGRDLDAAECDRLLAEPELRTWWPRPERLGPFVEAIAALRHGPIVLTEGQSQARLTAILDQAVATLFPPAVTARRLQAVAYVLAESGRIAAAEATLAAADWVRRQPDRVGEHPLLRTFVHRAIGTMLAASQTRDERRDALVLTPAELAARAPGRSPSHPPRSRG